MKNPKFPHDRKRPLIMGILNVTPDSFSDGGDFFTLKEARNRAFLLAQEGADIIDVGAESTRPGALALSEQEEWQRLFPLIDALGKEGLGIPISIDTSKASVMEKALDLGASIWNNVKGLDISPTGQKILRNRALKKYIAMHMHLEPKSMQKSPLKGKKAALAVEQFFSGTEQQIKDLGLAQKKIYLDPGIGFGKTLEANLLLLQKIPTWAQHHKLCVGISRKSFLRNMFPLGESASYKDYDGISKVCEFFIWLMGAQIIRTHDVAGLKVAFEKIGPEIAGAP